MAAPITHIALTHLLSPTLFPHTDSQQLYLGTSFPDIRYLDVISRDQTHHNHVTLTQIRQSDPFHAGLLFHSLVDHIHEHYMQTHGIYNLIPESPYKTQALKIYEDIILYDKISRLELTQISNYFNQIIPAEQTFGISDAHITQWHQAIQSYISQPPNPQTITQFINHINKPPEMATQINHLIQQISENLEITTSINNFYHQFPNVLPKE